MKIKNRTDPGRRNRKDSSPTVTTVKSIRACWLQVHRQGMVLQTTSQLGCK